MLSGEILAAADDDGDSLNKAVVTNPSVTLKICREKLSSPGPGGGGLSPKSPKEDEKKRYWESSQQQTRQGPESEHGRRVECSSSSGTGGRGGSTGADVFVQMDDSTSKEKKKTKKKSHHRHQHHHQEQKEKKHSSSKTKKESKRKLINYQAQQRNLSPYFKNATLKPLQHPLEENIFTGLLITLIAVALAFVIGIPVLLISGVLLVIAVIIRYLSVIIEGCFNYFRFICSNRTFPSTVTVPYIFPRDRLAFANDVRWLGERSPKKCQSVLHTVLIFEGSMELNSLRNFIQGRVLESETIDGEIAYPRLLQKLVPVFGGHRWESDSSFDIKDHIFHGPAHLKTEAQIQQHLGLLLTKCLPTDKPLWEIHLFPCYGVLRDTLAIVRVHQCLADGMTLVRILLHSLADQQQMHIPQRPNFASLSFGFNVIRSLIVGPLTLFLWFCMTSRDRNYFSRPLFSKSSKTNATSLSKLKIWKESHSTSTSSATPTSSSKQNMATQLLLANDRSKKGYKNDSKTNVVVIADEPSSKGKNAGKSRGGSSSIDNNQESGQTPDKISHSTKSPQTSSSKSKGTATNECKRNSDGGAGGIWKVGWSASLTVPKIARVKQIMRSSFNDVLLSAAAGSIRQYLQSQGIAFPGDIKVVIPVDLRNDVSAPKISKRLGCKVASILAAIPSGIEAAIPRLWATRQRLDEVKASADPVVAYGATTILINILPQKIGAFMLDNITDKASLQFCNLAGPTSTLMVGGFPLKGVYPIYPPSGKIRVAITVFTYSDQVHVTVVSHRSMPNFCQSLLNGMSQQIDQLSKQLSHRRVPGESRRTARNSSTMNSEITKPPTKQIHFQLQVVQEELQELSQKLDHQEPFSYSVSGEDDEAIGRELAGEPAPPVQFELRTRLKTLKTEFNDLIGELRRRTSIVEGANISFEDEEDEEEFRKPRKRALSVVSTSARRNSLFSVSRAMMTPESSHHSYSSDENLSALSPPQQQSPDLHLYSPSSSQLRHSSSSIRTTAV